MLIRLVIVQNNNIPKYNVMFCIINLIARRYVILPTSLMPYSPSGIFHAVFYNISETIRVYTGELSVRTLLVRGKRRVIITQSLQNYCPKALQDNKLAFRIEIKEIFIITEQIIGRSVIFTDFIEN